MKNSRPQPPPGPPPAASASQTSEADGDSGQWSHDFEDVLDAELDRIRGESNHAKEAALARAHGAQLVGLAFSGGGIRSATFNLGVLQGLARMKLLSMFDYLSTVSGGGYIGSWLMAWIKRAENVKDVQAGLHPEWGQQAGRSEPREIHFLRQYSNYLTPKLGWLGADTWTVVAVYVRNLILNLIILGSAVAVLLLAPRWLIKIADLLWRKSQHFHCVWSVIALLCLAGAIAAIVWATRYFGVRCEEERRRAGESDLENDKNAWKDLSQTSMVDVRSGTGPTAWHRIKFFENFSLRLGFKVLRPGGEGRIYLWKCTTDEAAAEQDAEEIYLADPALVSKKDKSKYNGRLNGRKPVRLPEFRPGEVNLVEIVCVKQHCVVRINNETVNAARMKQWAQFQRNGSSAQNGAIGLARDGIEFIKINVAPIETSSSIGGTPRFVKWCIAAPVFVAAFMAAFIFGYGGSARPGSIETDSRAWLPQGLAVAFRSAPWPWWLCGLAAGLASAFLVVAVRLGFLFWHNRGKQTESNETDVDNKRAEFKKIGVEAMSITIAAGLGGICAWALYFVFERTTLWEVHTWALPLLVCAFLFTLVLYVGLLGRQLPDERREWWSRLSALLLIGALAWIAIFSIAFYAPLLFDMRNVAWRWITGVVSLSWIVSTILGLIAARSASTGSEKSNRAVEFLAKVAPYIFVAGFFIFLAKITDMIVTALAGNHPSALIANATLIDLIHRHWESVTGATHLNSLFWATAIPLVAALWLSRQMDINQFSMHMLYRNRLGRCYLGASNRFRQAQPFTGFAEDDFKLSELADLPFAPRSKAAPYPIVNAALNLVGGKELAWQQRKAASFVFTPAYCGYEFAEVPPGYCPTSKFASKPNPITLATAMAISGAAASPNMGYHTSPAPAFLMTVFNVRLGWWLGNPRTKHAWQRSGPLNVLLSLMRELFGLTTEAGSYIYLSDGGHFENLGVYELVRRRCRFILACDAEEDHAFGFGGLGNVIEKCRADFGIEIEIDVEPIRGRSEKGHSQWHCAIGTIHYSEVDEDARDGILVYLKSSLTGDEPTDVLRYADENREFPHQSTSDQWFDESQFESYRALGCHIVESVFGAVNALERLHAIPKEDLFVGLAQAWYPPSSATKESFTKHTRAIVAIYDELRENQNLAFLNAQIYPEWRKLFERSEGWLAQKIREYFPPDLSKSLSARLPKKAVELQAGFYVCNSVIQLMEDAYVDLDLEKEFDHPDNRGWMNFFKHWSWSPMFRVAWTISASNYGARFQSFCERHLNLTIGTIEVEREDVPVKAAVSSEEVQRMTKLITDTLLDWVINKPFSPQVIATAINEAKQFVPDWNDKADPLDAKPSKEEFDNIRRTLINAANAHDLAQPPEEDRHRDEEWMGAATMLVLIRWDASEKERARQASKVAELINFRAQNILHRLSTNAIAALNGPERELVELFFVYNPTLLPAFRLFRFELVPGYHATGSRSDVRENDLRFIVGFAIVAKIDKGPKLVYFRVRDHLRTIGLGRWALKELIKKQQSLVANQTELVGENNRLEVELQQMHPNAHEVPTDDDREVFERLFDSVVAALDQEENPQRNDQLKTASPGPHHSSTVPAQVSPPPNTTMRT